MVNDNSNKYFDLFWIITKDRVKSYSFDSITIHFMNELNSTVDPLTATGTFSIIFSLKKFILINTLHDSLVWCTETGSFCVSPESEEL